MILRELNGDEVRAIADELRDVVNMPGWRRIQALVQGREQEALEQLCVSGAVDPGEEAMRTANLRGLLVGLRRVNGDLIGLFETEAKLRAGEKAPAQGWYSEE